MYLPVAITAFLFSYWLFKKKYKTRPFKLPVDIQSGDVVHGAFGSLLANLSLKGMYIDVMAGILLYLTHQFAVFIRNNDAIDRDIATFTAGYFGTLVSSFIGL